MKSVKFCEYLNIDIESHSKIFGKVSGRNLRPVEFELLRDAMDPNIRRICTFLLLTGLRYAELQRLRENPDWLDGKFIYLPRGSMLKVKAKNITAL